MGKDKLDFLKVSIAERLKNIDSKRIYYRRQAFSAYILTAVLSAITTILLGLKIPELNEFVRISALVITTVITVISAYNAFFNNKELWIANNIARNRFYKLHFEIEYAEKAPDTISDEVVTGFKNSYQEILDDLNATWQKTRRNEK